jgi:hypothetical protein
MRDFAWDLVKLFAPAAGAPGLFVVGFATAGVLALGFARARVLGKSAVRESSDRQAHDQGCSQEPFHSISSIGSNHQQILDMVSSAKSKISVGSSSMINGLSWRVAVKENPRLMPACGVNM